MNEPRYFIVPYQVQEEDGKMISGMVSIITEDGSYINRGDITLRIKELHKFSDKSIVTLQNIIELNENDYLDWYE